MENSKTSSGMFDDCDVIFQYSRRDAVADGVLIDVTAFEKRMLSVFKYPIAIACGAWAMVFDHAAVVDDMNLEDSLTLRDFLLSIAIGIRNQVDRGIAKEGVMKININVCGEIQTVWVECGPGDDGLPVLTIMSQLDI